MTETKKEIHCSFCFKSQHDVKKIVAGPEAFICNECLDVCLKAIGRGPTKPDEVRLEAIRLANGDVCKARGIESYLRGTEGEKMAVPPPQFNDFLVFPKDWTEEEKQSFRDIMEKQGHNNV